MEKITQEVMKDLKSKNIIISGLKDEKNENCLQVVVAFIKGMIPTFNGDHIETTYRMGTEPTGTRPILAKLKDISIKQQKKISAQGSKKDCSSVLQ